MSEANNNIMSKSLIKKIKPGIRGKKIRDIDKPKILMRIARGDKFREIKEDYGIKSDSTLIHLKNNNKKLLEQVRLRISDKMSELEERLMFKSLSLLQTKYERLEDQPRKLDNMRATELTRVYKDIHDKRQSEKQQVEDIALHNKDIGELKAELQLHLKSAETGNTLTLVKKVFD